ncbi:MAG: radical SAM protein [Candidatus Latescibacterota bacterium]|nr:MAG: radical SAM protein [Candidatus Latescibacterota bacterium]
MLLPEVASRTLHPAPPESYTIFTGGCNFKCLHCQNWSISQYPDNGMRVDGFVNPAALAREAVSAIESPAGRLMGADRIFFSGGEPTIHLPYIEKVVFEARKLNRSCKVNFDTNGFMTESSLERILDFTTSMTFDIKAYHDEIHRAMTGAPVEPVLRNAEIVATRAPEKLWEYRIVVIPGVNEEDVGPICRFLARLSGDLPVCFLAFRPNFVMENHPRASRGLMTKCLSLASEAGLRNTAWAGVTGLPGSFRNIDTLSDAAYERAGAKTAGSYASSHGCETHPRDCGTCPASDACTIKRIIPGKSC